MNYLVDLCNGEFKLVVDIVKFIIALIQYAVPIAIIILGSIDLFKAVVASKEDEIKTAQKLLIKRVIYGVVVFFVVLIVKLVFGQALGQDLSGISCFFD